MNMRNSRCVVDRTYQELGQGLEARLLEVKPLVLEMLEAYGDEPPSLLRTRLLTLVDSAGPGHSLSTTPLGGVHLDTARWLLVTFDGDQDASSGVTRGVVVRVALFPRSRDRNGGGSAVMPLVACA